MTTFDVESQLMSMWEQETSSKQALDTFQQTAAKECSELQQQIKAKDSTIMELK